jgi:lysophospholipase L1-like esterase
VTVWLAVNDLNARVPLARYSAELISLLSGPRQQTEAKVLAARPQDISEDGFHPSATGYRRIADVFYLAAQAALSARQ